MIRWVKEHKIFTAITSVILVLCIIIAISYFNGTGFFGKTLQQGNAVVSEPVTKVSYGIKDGIKGLFHIRKIMSENDSLQDEVDRLEKELIALQLTEQELTELRELKDALNYVGSAGEQAYVSANIIAVDNSSFFNVFTINAGAESGISEDAVVIAGNGLVGRVSEAGEGYAKVVSVIDDNAEISFQVLRDMDILGVISGDGNGSLDGYTFKADVGIVEGDMLVTTGIGLYPEGIEIGRVTKVEFNSDVQLMTVKAEPTVDFKDLRKVMVLL